MMVLSIADWILKVECHGLAIEALPNWKPFLMPDDADGVAGEESLLAVLQTEVDLPACEGSPIMTASPDSRLLRIWLLSGCCCLELAVPDRGICCRLRADRDWRHVQTDWGLNGVSDYDLLNDLLMLTFIYASAFRHTVLVHASCVVTNDAGVAFLGPSGIGKSTHSRLWLKHIPGTRLLNDDQPVLRLFPWGEVRIYGSPWSGKTPCYHNEWVELRALFRMEQASENRAIRLSPLQSFRFLLGAVSLIGRDGMSFACISRTVAGVAGRIPAYVLRNRPEREAAELSYALFRECL